VIDDIWDSASLPEGIIGEDMGCLPRPGKFFEKNDTVKEEAGLNFSRSLFT